MGFDGDGIVGSNGLVSLAALVLGFLGFVDCILSCGGGGGTSGMFSGEITFSVLGVAGVKLVGDNEGTGPGGAGVGPLAVWLWDPGRTTVSESWIPGLVFPSFLFESAMDRWTSLLALIG